MKIGLITDVHNDGVRLRIALDIFSNLGVDKILTIGDTFDPMAEPEGIEEVTRLLSDHKVMGVWGNHDFSFCREIPDYFIERFPATMFEYLKSIEPRIELGDVHFSHRELFVDPFDPIELWGLTGEEVNNLHRAQKALQDDRYHLQFVGHYHEWMAFDRAGRIDWSGQRKIQFKAEDRYFIAVAAVCDGWCAFLDTNQRWLEPIRCEPS